MKWSKKLFHLVLVNFVALSIANLDIFNKCPDFRPAIDFNVEEINGTWFVLEMIKHYEGRQPLIIPEHCVKLVINGIKNGTKGVDENPKPHYNRVDLSMTNLNETLHTMEQFNYDLKVNSTKLGIWLNYTKIGIDDKKIQIINPEANFTVITFCEKGNLITFILSREIGVNETEKIIHARQSLERRGLLVTDSSIVKLCQGSSMMSLNSFVLILMFQILKLVSF